MWLSWRKENRIEADFATVVGRKIDPTINFGDITPAIRIEFALRFLHSGLLPFQKTVGARCVETRNASIQVGNRWIEGTALARAF